MTSEISSNNKNINYNKKDNKNGILNISLFWDNMRRQKILIIITGIIMFFASPFIELLAHATNNGSTAYSTQREFFEAIERNTLRGGVFGLMTAVAIVFGLSFALLVMRYMHDRKALVFYSSIPVKKRTLFLTQCLSGIIYFTIPLIIGYIISVVIMPSYITFISLSKIFAISWFIFLLVYSFVIMCANIAGNAFNSVLSGVYLAVIAVVFYGCLVAFTNTFYRFTTILTDSGIPSGFLLPVVYFISDIADKWVSNFTGSTLINMLFMFIVSIGFLIIGGILNRINKTENAEKPFYFKISQSIFKYSILAIMVILSAIGFYQALYENVVYMIIGIVAGGFFAFMLINFIIYRNIREVFSGIKPFAIFVAAASVILLAFAVDIFGVDKNIPKTSGIESIEIIKNNSSFSYHKYKSTGDYTVYDEGITNKKITDSAIIDLVSGALGASMNSNDNYNDKYPFSSLIQGMQIKYNLKNGFTVNKLIPYSFYFDNQADTDEFTKSEHLLWENKNFRALFFYPVTDRAYIENIINLPGNRFDITITAYQNGTQSYSSSISKDDTAGLITSLNDDIFSDTFNMQETGNLVYRVDLAIYNNSQNGNSERHQFYIDINDGYTKTATFIAGLIANGDFMVNAR